MFKTQHERDATAPPHPGEILKEEFLARVALGADAVERLARHVGLDADTLTKLIAEETAINGEIAAKLGAAFETGPRYWLALQMQYDLWAATETGTAGITPLKLATRPLKLAFDRVHASV